MPHHFLQCCCSAALKKNSIIDECVCLMGGVETSSFIKHLLHLNREKQDQKHGLSFSVLH